MPARYTREPYFWMPSLVFKRYLKSIITLGRTVKMGFSSTELASVFSNPWKRNFLLAFTKLSFRLCYLLPVGLDNQENPTPDTADYKSSTEFTRVQNFSGRVIS